MSVKSSASRQDGGFTLLEVLIALAILSLSLSALISAQMQAIRATAYSRDLTTAMFLAEYQLIELEWETKRNGWQKTDINVDGDFAEQGWQNYRYKCLVDFLELPEYTAMLDAKADTEDAAGGADNVMDVGEQNFSMIGMVWPQLKSAIESAIRKASCEVSWKTNGVDYTFDVSTFWTHPDAMTDTSQFLRDAALSADDNEDDPASGGGSGGSAGGGAAPPRTAPTGGGGRFGGR